MPGGVTDPPIAYEGTISALQLMSQTGSGVVEVLAPPPGQVRQLRQN
jgi:hypothetical protein